MLSAPPRRRISCAMSERTSLADGGSPRTRFRTSARLVRGWFAFAPGGRVAHAGISTVDPSVPLVGYGY
jgi:hypothetical protein